MKDNVLHPDSGASFNTLAQGRTDPANKEASSKGESQKEPHPIKAVQGKGIDASDKELLEKLAKRKTISKAVALALIRACEAKGDTERLKTYWNTFYCLDSMTVANGRIYGNYCKNRCCTRCLAIRKAEVINKYLPIIQTWEQPYFVTLTIKAVPEERLSYFVKHMGRAFAQIVDKYRKRQDRGTGKKIIALRSLESNFSPKNKTYNPHYHLIVPNLETAKTLCVEWQKKWTKKYVSAWAQKPSRITNNLKCLIEVVKYGSKIFTEWDKKNKNKSKIPPRIYANALDNILAAFKGHVLLTTYGFSLPKQEQPEKPPMQLLAEYEDVVFDSYRHDWVNEDTGEILTGYIPNGRLKNLLGDIDVESG